MLFYGFQVAIIADLGARFKLRWRTIYIIGLIYGIFEEGFAVFTMEASGPSFVRGFRFLGLNVTYSMYIDVFHSLISVLSAILIIRIVWPERVSEPFLHRRHYAVIVPVIIGIYAYFIRLFLTFRYPETSALVLLAGGCVVLALLGKISQRRPMVQSEKPRSRTGYFVGSSILVASALLLPLLIPSSTAGFAIKTVILLLASYGFFKLFDRADKDPDFFGGKQLLLFSTFVVFWLILGTFLFLRSPLGDVVCFAGVALQICLGLRAVRRLYLRRA